MANDNYFNSKQFKDNLSKYEDSRTKGEFAYMDADELNDIAEYFYNNGKIDESIEAIDYAISLFPGATGPLVFRSRIALIVNNDPQKAESFAEQIADKSDLDYFYIKAEIMIFCGQVEESDKYLTEKFNEIDEDEQEDFIIDVSTMYADYDRMDMAQKWLQSSQDKESADYQELQGRIAMQEGNYKESNRIFNELLDKDPFSSPYWNQLASSQYMSNEIKDSITSSEFSIAINPNDDEAILNKANGLFFLGNIDEAMKYYQKLSQLKPNDETGELFQGITLIKLNRLQEAVIHLQKAEVLAENQPQSQPQSLLEIYQTLAYTLSSLGKPELAISYIDKATSIQNANEDELTVLRGHIFLEQENFKAARKFFKKALRHSMSSPQIILRIAISMFDNGYINQAYEMLKTLLDIVNEAWTDGYSYFAACCLELGKDEEYADALRKACDKNPSEVKSVLGDELPPDLNTSEYFDYLIKNKK
jgi:tetratricopeptide (TPR) repeat protein